MSTLVRSKTATRKVTPSCKGIRYYLKTNSFMNKLRCYQNGKDYLRLSLAVKGHPRRNHI